MSLVLPHADDYYRRLLGDDGWIARARRFDYPTTGDQVGLPPEFFSVTAFLNYCARTFAPAPPEGVARRTAEGFARASRFFREGRRLGWFGARHP